jgi:tripartite-type tricarboxylate transporter receptor subunit TctC
VENAPGASGIIGAQQAACVTPDGYTPFFANASTFTSVSNQDPLVVSVYTELPMMTLPELIAYGKARPGKLSYAVDAAWAPWLAGS